MRRTLVLLTTALLIVLFTAPAGNAANAHFKRGGSPTCTVSTSGATSSTTCTATMTGLGNADVHIETTVSGSAVYQCRNNGGNVAPGQNRVLVGPATTPTDIDSSAIKNGNLTFVTNPAVLSAPDTVAAAAAGCPSSNWTGVNPQLLVTSVVLLIQQPAGTTLFTCSASNSAGLSGTVALTC